ncbi:lipocalin-like domain-containing protein [Sphingomonas jatrophae]|uniref:Lipocalin-like domain-containing protein n=1 Tax=Sphingomonas jatrophae TaxID=1166337 RepID=A0A1I6KJD4_9SPHN|nr:lipocalin-like domain-containing protein [Sphingomonas jatrophae]SFR91264.1 Lipocalin-like domain-containing protein [Sphingomonas jatrophae]
MTGQAAPLPHPPEAAFVGAWDLVLWTSFRADGNAHHPFGRDCIGQILYTADGRMSCHLTRAGRQPLGAGIYDVSDAALGATTRDYSGYFGTWTVDAAAGIVTHHVLGAWYPDWIGLDQPRRFSFEGDELVLEAETGGERVQLRWRRVAA